MFIIGLSALVLGVFYVTINEPWLLNKEANEKLLGVTYNTLFAQNANRHLPNYLTLMYRFFGWWVVSIGLLISVYVLVTKMGTQLARNILHVVTVIILTGIYCIEYHFIPETPFLWLTHSIALLFLVSIYGSVKLKQYD
jgi:hypothetical protein